MPVYLQGPACKSYTCRKLGFHIQHHPVKATIWLGIICRICWVSIPYEEQWGSVSWLISLLIYSHMKILSWIQIASYCPSHLSLRLKRKYKNQSLHYITHSTTFLLRMTRCASSRSNHCTALLFTLLTSLTSTHGSTIVGESWKRSGLFADDGQINEFMSFNGDNACQCFRIVILLISHRVDHYHMPNLVVLTWR